MLLKILQFLLTLSPLAGIGLIWPNDALGSEPPCFEDKGGFTTSLIDEASGLALIPKGEEGAGGFYVINDSGDLPRFFRTDRDGRNIIEFRIDGWKPFDTEDLSLGPCPSGLKGRCLAIADIGDNRSKRKKVEIGLIELSKLKVPAGRTSVSVRLDRKVTFSYPDRPHNAEAFALVADGVGLIVTKEQDPISRSPGTAQVFTVDLTSEKKTEAKARGSIGVDGLVTGLSVANPETVSLPQSTATGRLRFLLLTYRSAVEVEASWTLGQMTVVRIQVIRFDSMEQQEAITYDESMKGFFVATEAPLSSLKWFGVSSRALSPLRYVWPPSCRP